MAARRALSDQFRMLFEAAPNGVMAVDANGSIILLNAQMEKMFGYSREELIGRPAEVLIPERFRQRHDCLRKKFAAAPQMRPMGAGRDLFGARKDGSEFAVEIGLNPAATGMGDIFIATVVDITERKRAAEEENAHEHARKNVQLCQQLGLPAAVLQHDGQVLLVNGLFKELHSQFKFSDDRIELANPTANEFFKRALACLDRKIGDKIVAPTSVLRRTVIHLCFSSSADEWLFWQHDWHSGCDNAWCNKRAVGRSGAESLRSRPSRSASGGVDRLWAVAPASGKEAWYLRGKRADHA